MRAILRIALLSALTACASAPSANVSPPSGSGGGVAPHQLELTQRRARVIRAAVTDWRAQHVAGACPTVATLKADRNLDALADDLDAWGHEFIVRCTATETRISSLGPDGTHQSGDDIEVEPAPAPNSKAPPPPAAAHTAPVGDAQIAVGAAAAAMNRVLRVQIDPRVRDCYQKILGREPKPEEKVEGTITVGPDGTVKKASLSTAALKDHVVRCVAEAIEKAKFEPAPDGADRTVKYP